MDVFTLALFYVLAFYNECDICINIVLMNGCFHNGPAICSRSVINGPMMAVMARDNTEDHYSHPRAIITDREHRTGPIKGK
jgi:hypothetical protein